MRQEIFAGNVRKMPSPAIAAPKKGGIDYPVARMRATDDGKRLEEEDMGGASMKANHREPGWWRGRRTLEARGIATT